MTTGPYGDVPPPGNPMADPAGVYATASPPGGYPAGSYPGYPPAGMGATRVGDGAFPQPRNGIGTAALVVGIIGLTLCWTVYTGWILNVLAIVFGVIGRQRANRGEATNRSSATAGLTLGLIGIGLWVVLIVVFIAVFTGVAAGVGTHRFATMG